MAAIGDVSVDSLAVVVVISEEEFTRKHKMKSRFSGRELFANEQFIKCKIQDHVKASYSIEFSLTDIVLNLKSLFCQTRV